MTQTAIDIVQNYLEHGFDQLGKESKYNLLNKFGPKKCPEKSIKRENVPIIYSWSHYASQEWFNFLRKNEEDLKEAEERKTNPGRPCSFCSAPESNLRKHKFCSACKQAFYCSTDCQKYDWAKKHKNECKELQAKAKAAGKK